MDAPCNHKFFNIGTQNDPLIVCHYCTSYHPQDTIMVRGHLWIRNEYVKAQMKKKHENCHSYNGRGQGCYAPRHEGNRCRGKHSPLHYVSDELLKLDYYALTERYGVSRRTVQKERERRKLYAKQI